MQEFNSLMGKYANKPDSFSAINASEIPVNGRYTFDIVEERCR